MAFPFLEKPGQHERNGDFHDFRRLDDNTDIQPASRAFLTSPNAATASNSAIPKVYTGTAKRISVCGGTLAAIHMMMKPKMIFLS